MRRLQGKSVVLFGAGSSSPGWSNGRACAVAYGAAGASVVCVDNELERAELTVKLMEERGGVGVPVEADATDETQVRHAVERALAEFGRVDVLHNNVGYGATSGTPDQIAAEDWDREIAQNLTSAYLGIRCVVPVMREAGGGVITNTSSLMSVRFLHRPSVAYSAGKAAVEALTRSCAAGYGRDNIRVNCLRIGFSETPLVMSALEERGLTESEQDEAMARSRAKVPLRGEHTDPFDVADAAVFLASDQAKSITGVILNVDGGLDCAPI
jgi:NAD(P)-dependent dehydrogenase (short-subunit alcohol dehydrogenase family)